MDEDVVNLILHTVAETIDSDKVGFLVTEQPDIMDATQEQFLYLMAGIDIDQIGIKDTLKRLRG